jgi:DNA-binding winged helix-turn-helix (wHTH) protein
MAQSARYEFGGFHLDPARRLLHGPDGQRVSLTPKVFDTLLHFVERPGELLSKRSIMQAVWGDVIVEENSLDQHISTLRRVFGETPGENRFIVTVPGRGYRFVPALRTERATVPASAAAGEESASAGTDDVELREPVARYVASAASPRNDARRPSSALSAIQPRGRWLPWAAGAFGMAVAAAVLLAVRGPESEPDRAPEPRLRYTPLSFEQDGGDSSRAARVLSVSGRPIARPSRIPRGALQPSHPSCTCATSIRPSLGRSRKYSPVGCRKRGPWRDRF